ncbi:hypothetical protein DY245_15015 [Streptomyces inhibens]|uniref:Uncharacterized protein n=1 Tax=Streptomyces inhibens TaxID=2293571 RepID=A0A371Q4E7_STRIH|nr:hypothetical protein DY245_15015 [Streptomyces inhibens]
MIWGQLLRDAVSTPAGVPDDLFMEAAMSQHTETSTAGGSGLVRARRQIQAARARGATPSDGGGTGRSDGND